MTSPNQNPEGPTPPPPPNPNPFTPDPEPNPADLGPRMFLPSTPSPPGQSQGPFDGPGADPGRSGSSAPSTRRARASKKKELKEVARAAVETTGGIAHTLLCRESSAEAEAGLWLPDPEDVDNLSDPIAGLASRRVPEGVDNPDASDVVRLLMGLVGYVVKQLKLRSALRPQRSDDPTDPSPDPATAVVDPL